MEDGDAGAFTNMDATDATLGDDGVDFGRLEGLEQGLPDGVGEVVTQGTFLEPEGAAHSAAGTGLNPLNFSAESFEPSGYRVAVGEWTLMAGAVESVAFAGQGSVVVRRFDID